MSGSLTSPPGGFQPAKKASRSRKDAQSDLVAIGSIRLYSIYWKIVVSPGNSLWILGAVFIHSGDSRVLDECAQRPQYSLDSTRTGAYFPSVR